MLTLPKPPSTNTMYKYTSRGGFASSYISKKGKDWFEEAGLLLKKNQSRRKKSIDRDLEVWIELYTCRMQDIDNILKPTLDLLSNFCIKCLGKYTSRTKCKCKKNLSLFKDDRQVISLHATKHKVPHRVDECIKVEWFELDKNVSVD